MNRGFLDKLLERIQRVQPGDVQNYLADLAREKGFLETIFNVILEGIIVTDNEGRIIYLNKAACGFFGLDASESLGRPLSGVVRGLDWKEIAGESGASNRDLEVFYPEHRLLNFYSAALMAEGRGGGPPRVEGRAIILRDITASAKSAEETIESERVSAVTLLAAGVAHEIGNPLNSLGIHLQLLERRIRKLSARGRAAIEESVAVARREVERLDQIIHQFLQAIRPQPVRTAPQNLNRLVEESVAFLKPEIQDRDILVEVELDDRMPPLHLDHDQFRQAFYNIIRNAFQAMRLGGILRIRTHAGENYVYVSFSDTGGGISPENLRRIFDPYFTTKAGGSGLGLMIVQRIVRAHGGEVGIQSTEGKGVTVTIRLPREDRAVRFLEPGDHKPPPQLMPGTPV